VTGILKKIKIAIVFYLKAYRMRALLRNDREKPEGKSSQGTSEVVSELIYCRARLERC
jgi:hypothetical protein